MKLNWRWHGRLSKPSGMIRKNRFRQLSSCPRRSSPDNYLDISLNQVMAVQLDWFARLSQACKTVHFKCGTLLGPIMDEVRALSETSLGRYDACGLSKPIYSVAALIARSPALGTKDDFLVCLRVIQRMLWVYSEHEKQVADLRFLWNVSRDEPLEDPWKFTESWPPTLPRRRPISSPHPPPSNPIPRPSSGAKSARSRASSGRSVCIPEGHNSPDDDVSSRKSPRRMARFLSKVERNTESGSKSGKGTELIDLFSDLA